MHVLYAVCMPHTLSLGLLCTHSCLISLVGHWLASILHLTEIRKIKVTMVTMVTMVTTKHCCHDTCQSDSRCSEREYMKGVTFIRFPNPWRDQDKCKRWVHACRRQGFTEKNVTKDTYICSKHFVGGNGPTLENPDPIPETKEQEVGLWQVLIIAVEQSNARIATVRQCVNCLWVLYENWHNWNCSQLSLITGYFVMHVRYMRCFQLHKR